MNLSAAFEAAVTLNPGKAALYWGEAEFSFRDLRHQSHWLARHLQQSMGLSPGIRVGLLLKNCPEFVPALFGILQAGGVVVPINNFLKPFEVGFILNDAGINLLITDEGPGSADSELVRSRPELRIIRSETITQALVGPAVEFAPIPRSASDLAVIIYTSGTTGRPKGAMLSHGNLLHNVASCREVLEAVDFDRFVVLLPMFHSFMLCVGILLPILVNGSIVLIKSVHPMKNVLQEIIHRQATLLPAIPQFFRTLANTPLPGPLPLRLCLSGAAPLPLEVLREFGKKLPAPLIEGYGLSEASPVVSLNPLRGARKPGSIGKPIPRVEVTIQNELGETLPPRSVGEICVRGGNVMKGYWNQPEETAKAFRNGWLLTGDLGYADEDEFLFITDRKKDMLLVNGINVYPREIEEVLYQFPGLKEAAVVGVPDPRKGEQPVAFAVPAEGVSLNEKALIDFVREKLADYKVPRRVKILSVLPRNATGKVLKTELRKSLVSENAP